MRFFSFLALMLLAAAQVNAATITVPVTNTDASGPNGLEEAINTVNAGNPNDIYLIEIDLPAPAGLAINLQSPLPAITQRAVIIRGTRTRNERLNRISGTGTDTILTMGGSNALFYSIENLHLEAGGTRCASLTAPTITVFNSVFSQCPPESGNANALFVNGTTTVRNSAFLFNETNCTTTDCRGAAIRAVGGKLEIESSYFGFNRAIAAPGEAAFGGAISAGQGIEVRDTFFEANQAGNSTDGSGFGGAIHAVGKALIYRSSFIFNAAIASDARISGGGAIAHRPKASINGSLFRVWNVFFEDNTATGVGRGGAIKQFPDDFNVPQLDIRNSTFNFNLAYGTGHALYLAQSTDEAVHNTIFNSRHGTACFKVGSGGPLNGDWNLLTTRTSCDVGGTVVPYVRFGESRTVGNLRFQSLLYNSPAIDAGNPAPSDFNDPTTCRPADIIDTDRPQAGSDGAAPTCDIGAQEYVDILFSNSFEN